MVVYCSGTKGDLERRRRKHPANLLHDVVKESVSSIQISKAERLYIVDSFKDLYQAYWSNSQGELPVVPAMDVAEIRLTILNHTQHLASIAASDQKSSDENAWAVLQALAKLMARTEEVNTLNSILAKKSPASNETLSPQLERSQHEAEAIHNELAHVEAKVRDLRAAQEELRYAVRRLANSEAEITCLQ